MSAYPQGASASVLLSHREEDLLRARDTLAEARSIGEFVQGITVIVGDRGIDLNSDQTVGLYYVMQDMLDRIRKSEELMEGANVSLIEGETE